MTRRAASTPRVPSRWVGRVVRLALICFSLWLILPPLMASRQDPTPGVSVGTAAATLHRGTATTRPIESIRVGQRVLGQNPEVTAQERAHRPLPDWRDWVRLRLALPLEEQPQGSVPSVIAIELLRPETWLRDRLSLHLQRFPVVVPPWPAEPIDSSPGRSVDSRVEEAGVPQSPLRPIYREFSAVVVDCKRSGFEVLGLAVDLDLAEMGASGRAVVTEIRPCPEIHDSPGQVVTGTFAHPPTHDVFDVHFSGEPDPIGVTANHLFWSVDRAQFLAVAELTIGEQVYHVGHQGILTHNAYAGVGANTVAGSQATGAQSINSRLIARLQAWRSYLAHDAGMSMQRWVQATQRQSWGTGNLSGFASFSQSAGKSVHGNSLAASGTHDIYAIRDASTGTILHFGETGRGYLARFTEHQRNFVKKEIDFEV